MTETWTGLQDNFPSFDHLRIHYRRLSPSSATCFTMLLIHGLGEHAGRYNNFYNYFVPKGYEVFAPDLRGHGLSEGKRGHIDSFDDYIKDTEYLWKKVEASRPAKCGLTGGNILVGHSMGGLIALRYALDHQEDFRAVVVTGPLLEIGVPVPGWKKSLGKFMSKIAPKLSMPNGLNPADLSRDPAVGKAYVADPLVNNLVSARWFTEINDTMEYVHANAGRLKLPILIMHGSADKLTNPNGSKRFFDNCGSQDKTLKIYDLAFHELYNEVNHLDVLSYLEGWLKERNL